MLIVKKSLFAIILLFILKGCTSSRLSYEEYSNILKAYPDYEYEETNSLPQFSYSDLSDSNLVKLRKTFNIDSIAGKGTETSQIINLMKWIHCSVNHDGSSKNPHPKNIFNIMRVCKSENRGVNCRMMSVMLHEVYLSFGLKSRYITCMPAEKDFKDCHVINAVYSNELHKWIYIDPTFQAFFTDEKGLMLSIQEVREKMIKDEKIIINDELNWSGGTYTSEDYLKYISKNLFRLASPIENEFDYESKNNRRYVELIPKGYGDISGNPNEKYFYTSNPNYFWQY